MTRPKCECGGRAIKYQTDPYVVGIFCERCGRRAYIEARTSAGLGCIAALDTFRSTAEATRAGSVRWLTTTGIPR